MIQFQKNGKNPILGPFLANFGPKWANKIFFKNQAPSLFNLGNFRLSCKKSETFYDTIWRKALYSLVPNCQGP